MTDSEEILRTRARALARPLDTGTAPVATVQLLEFQLGSERYAVETRDVGEVSPFKSLTPLPSTPPFVLGVVNVRGRIVPVFDLKIMFGLPQDDVTRLHNLVILSARGLEVGLLTDGPVAQSVVAQDALQRSLPNQTGVVGRYVKGITADGLVVLDVERLLTDPTIIVQEEVES